MKEKGIITRRGSALFSFLFYQVTICISLILLPNNIEDFVSLLNKLSVIRQLFYISLILLPDSLMYFRMGKRYQIALTIKLSSFCLDYYLYLFLSNFIYVHFLLLLLPDSLSKQTLPLLLNILDRDSGGGATIQICLRVQLRLRFALETRCFASATAPFEYPHGCSL